MFKVSQTDDETHSLLFCFSYQSVSLTLSLKTFQLQLSHFSEWKRLSTLCSLAARIWWWEIIHFGLGSEQVFQFFSFSSTLRTFPDCCTLIVSIELLVTGQRCRIVLNLVQSVDFSDGSIAKRPRVPTECKGYIDTRLPPLLPTPYIVYTGARVCVCVCVFRVACCMHVCMCVCVFVSCVCVFAKWAQ